jgi:hypothetical protein
MSLGRRLLAQRQAFHLLALEQWLSLKKREFFGANRYEQANLHALATCQI